MTDEISIAEFITAIERLPEDEPHGDPSVWYRTEKEHWLGWLRGYDGPGGYGRAAGTKRNAKLVYNRLVNPYMLLWLAEAAGVDSDRVMAAWRAAEGGTSLMQQAGAVRRQVPWAVVREALWPNRGT